MTALSVLQPKQQEDSMSTGNTFLAVFLGSKSSPRMAAWNALPEAERQAKTKEGIAAWKAWIEKHRDAVVEMGGPLGKTKKIAGNGIEDVSNDLSAFMVVRAASQEEAAGCLSITHTLRFSRANPWR